MFSIQVVLLDQFGNIATGDSSMVTLALGTHPKNATLTGNLTANVVNGIATFNNLIVNSSADFSLIATDNDGLPPITSSTWGRGKGIGHRSND